MTNKEALKDFVNRFDNLSHDSIRFIRKNRHLISLEIDEYKVKEDDGVNDFIRISLWYKEDVKTHLILMRKTTIKEITAAHSQVYIDEFFGRFYQELLCVLICGVDSIGKLVNTDTREPISALSGSTLLCEGLAKLSDLNSKNDSSIIKNE